jgi:hypothetical protein
LMPFFNDWWWKWGTNLLRNVQIRTMEFLQPLRSSPHDCQYESVTRLSQVLNYLLQHPFIRRFESRCCYQHMKLVNFTVRSSQTYFIKCLWSGQELSMWKKNGWHGRAPMRTSHSVIDVLVQPWEIRRS